MPPLALIGLTLMGLGILGPSSSARAREMSLRTGLGALQTAAQMKMQEKRLSLQETLAEREFSLQKERLSLQEKALQLEREALQLEVEKAKALYQAILKAARVPDEAMDQALLSQVQVEAPEFSPIVQDLQSKISEAFSQPQIQPFFPLKEVSNGRQNQ